MDTQFKYQNSCEGLVNIYWHSPFIPSSFVYSSVADPDSELRWGPGFGLLALPAFIPSVISSVSLKIRVGGGGGEGGGSPRSATVHLLL